MMYEVMVSGSVAGRYEDRASAEARLEEVRHSYLALVHPVDCMFIHEVKG